MNTVWRMGPMLSVLLMALGAGCGAREGTETYYPLAEGKTWTYRVALTQGERETTSTATVINQARRELQGKEVTPQQGTMFGQSQLRFLARDRAGICEIVTQPPGASEPAPRQSPNCVLKEPIRTGTAWDAVWVSGQFGRQTTFPTTKTIAGTTDTVTVPAGTFANAVKLTIAGRTEVNLPTGPASIEVEGTEWYAPPSAT